MLSRSDAIHRVYHRNIDIFDVMVDYAYIM